MTDLTVPDTARPDIVVLESLPPANDDWLHTLLSEGSFSRVVWCRPKDVGTWALPRGQSPAQAVREQAKSRLADLGFAWTFNGGEGAVRAAVDAGIDAAFTSRLRVHTGRLAASTAGRAG